MSFALFRVAVVASVFEMVFGLKRRHFRTNTLQISSFLCTARSCIKYITAGDLTRYSKGTKLVPITMVIEKRTINALIYV